MRVIKAHTLEQAIGDIEVLPGELNIFMIEIDARDTQLELFEENIYSRPPGDGEYLNSSSVFVLK
jgi:hypothetical protein